MTTYTAIPGSAIDQDSPATSDLFTLIRDNPIAMAEGATDAPVVAAGWHPYDMTAVGDGGDGEFYDFATDGTSASIETPAFVDGYEYAIRFEDFTTGGGLMQIGFYHAATAVWATTTSDTLVSGQGVRGIFMIEMPRLVAFGQIGRWLTPLASGSGGVISDARESVAVAGTTPSAVSKARIVQGSVSAGKLYLLRRREYLTG